jgi:hypothetical protein
MGLLFLPFACLEREMLEEEGEEVGPAAEELMEEEDRSRVGSMRTMVVRLSTAAAATGSCRST